MSLDDAFGFDLDQLGLVMLLDIFEETAIYTYGRVCFIPA